MPDHNFDSLKNKLKEDVLAAFVGAKNTESTRAAIRFQLQGFFEDKFGEDATKHFCVLHNDKTIMIHPLTEFGREICRRVQENRDA